MPLGSARSRCSRRAVREHAPLRAPRLPHCCRGCSSGHCRMTTGCGCSPLVLSMPPMGHSHDWLENQEGSRRTACGSRSVVRASGAVSSPTWRAPRGWLQSRASCVERPDRCSPPRCKSTTSRMGRRHRYTSRCAEFTVHGLLEQVFRVNSCLQALACFAKARVGLEAFVSGSWAWGSAL